MIRCALLLMLAGCYPTPAPKPLPAPVAGTVASALRMVASGLMIADIVGERTPARCIATTTATAVLLATADGVEAAAGAIPEIPSVSADLSLCRFAAVPIPSADIVAAVSGVAAVARAGLGLSRLQDRDCVGFTIAVSTADAIEALAPLVVAQIVGGAHVTTQPIPIDYTECSDAR